MGFFSVSVDLDEIDCYAAIHGLKLPSSTGQNTIYSRGLPRIERFIEELSIPVTFFVVGKDIEEGRVGASHVSRLAANGHEIGNHSMTHRYDLAWAQRTEQAEEIDRAATRIKEITGFFPVGFRSPGYNTSERLLELLFQRGYSYDSSVFPCPLYYSAKAMAMGVKFLNGQVSSAKMGDPRMLKAPVSPYRIGPEGVWSSGRGLLELPIAVLTKARIPYMGTSLALMGSIPARVLTRIASRQSFVNLELHGMDFTDSQGDGLAFLQNHQPDLRVPFFKKRKIYKRCIESLILAGLEPVTLQEAAARLFA